MRTYNHIGYFNEVGDIRAIAPLIAGKKFEEVFNYYAKGHGAFYEEGEELEVESVNDLQNGSFFYVSRDNKVYAIFYTFNPESILNEMKDNEDGDDSNEFVDIYELTSVEANYSLVGVDGNAFSVMGYVKEAMRKENFSRSEIDSYLKDAVSGDYQHLLAVSCDMVEKCNNRI